MAFNLGSINDPLAVQALEPSITQTTPGEVLGATAGAAFDSLPTVSLLRQQQRFNESGPDTNLKPVVDPRTAGSDVDAMAAERGDAPTRVTLQPEEANAKAKAAGAQVTFDKPIADTTAQSVIDQHITEQQRADVIARNGSAILSGVVPRFVAGSLLSLADPLNLAAMMIPAAPEAFVAERLMTASGVFERTLIRGAAGAANGAVGMTALEPLNYAMSKSDYNDWSAGDALRNIFMGAALGAGGYMLLGGLAGREHLNPNTSMEATRSAIAQIAEDRPVDVADLINHGEATMAADSLDRWHREQQRILADADASQAGGASQGRVIDATNPDRSGAIAAHEATLGQLREQAGKLRGEVDALTEKKITAGMDPETAARLDDVNHELGGVIPKARRAALEQERALLLEGRGTLDANTGDPLEQARTTAQIQGLSSAADRADSAAVATEQKLAELRQQQATEDAAAQAARTSADRSARIAQAKIDSREAVLQNLMERDVRVYAARIGVTLEEGEAATIAREIRTAQPAEAGDIITNHLNALSQRSGKGDALAPLNREPVGSVTEGLRAEAQGAAQDMARRTMNPPADPEAAAAVKANKATIESAPKLTGDLSKDAAEAEKLAKDAEADYEAQAKAVLQEANRLNREAGRPAVAEVEHGAELERLLKDADDTGNEGKAAADYATCLVGRGTFA